MSAPRTRLYDPTAEPRAVAARLAPRLAGPPAPGPASTRRGSPPSATARIQPAA